MTAAASPPGAHAVRSAELRAVIGAAGDRADALALPREIRELIGYRMHAGLGFSEVYW